MKSVHRRGTSPLITLVASAVITVMSTLVPLGVTVSGAQTIAQTRAEIASLSAQLARQEKSSEVTANTYDAAKAQLQSLTGNIITLQGRERAERAAVAVTTKAMVKAVIQSYVYSTAATQTVAVFDQDVTRSDARAVFESLVVGNLNELRSKLDKERSQLDTAISQVSNERSRAAIETSNLQTLLSDNIAAADQTRITLNEAAGALKTEIISYEVAAGAAAARVGNISAESSAVQAASVVGGQDAANLVLAAIAANTPPATTTLISGSPAGSAAGELAVSFAERQEGVPYVWGGETPGVGFDCSGLVQWAWAQAGYAMPRTTEEQYASLPVVPLDQLRPGDLLYYYNLDGDSAVDPVVLYVGAGPWGTNTLIAAAYTGTNISLAPIFSAGLVGARRP